MLLHTIAALFVASQAAGEYPGAATCPCTDASALLARSPKRQGESLPLSYGSSFCRAWDMNVSMVGCDTVPLKPWCTQHWCYVDRDQCRGDPNIEVIHAETQTRD